MLLYYIPTVLGLAFLSATLTFYFGRNKITKLVPFAVLTFLINCFMPIIGLVIPAYVATKQDIATRN